LNALERDAEQTERRQDNQGRIKMTTRKRKRWSQRVTETSNALDLDKGVFSREEPRSIARSLKRSAERSRRRKGNPFQSAMSMLTFYINRAGKNLSRERRTRLEAAKEELRTLYGKTRATRVT
jgi:hypothetical protein